MQLGNFIDVFLARHVSGTYAHHQEHWMLSCNMWFSVPSFWMGGGFESRCVGRACMVRMVQCTAPSIQKLGAENHVLQLNIQCS